MGIKEVQLTNKQHAVPQNIMDVEFKLIGDLTMRQFAYLIIFGGIAWVCFSVMRGAFRIPFTGFFAIFGLGLAFFTIGDRGMDQWVVNFIRSMYTSTQKVWRKDPIIPSIFLYQNLAVVKQEIITLAPTSSRRRLEEYLQYQTSSVKEDRLDIPEMSYTTMIRDAYAVSEPSTTVTTTYEEEPIVEEITPAMSTVSILTPAPVIVSVPDVTQPVIEQPSNLPNLKELPVAPTAPQPQPQPPSQPEHKRKHISVPKFVLPSRKEAYIPLSPITPDMHSGRVFTNLLPEQSEIILPVRGERILKTSEEADIEHDIEEKAEQLRKLIEQIKQDETYKKVIVPQVKPQPIASTNNIALSTPVPQPQIVLEVKKPENIPVEVVETPIIAQPSVIAQPPVAEPKEVTEAGNILESLKSENAFLNKEIERLRYDITKANKNSSEEVQKKAELEKLQKEKAAVSGEVQTIQSTLTDIKEKLQQKQRVTSSPTYATIHPLTDRPNILSGVVTNGSTNIALEGIVLIIKNQKGEPVRALKTNALGQFSISTPLANGSYTIEIDSSNKTGLLFDIISVEVKGVVIPPIDFIGVDENGKGTNG